MKIAETWCSCYSCGRRSAERLSSPSRFGKARDRSPPEVSPLPRPISPPPVDEITFTPTVVPASLQLVGFTQETFNGARGGLNLSWLVSWSSRTANLLADDIRNTVVVPNSPGRATQGRCSTIAG